MCIICIDIEKGKLTPLEALNNYSEMISTIDDAHREEVEEIIEYILIEEALLEVDDDKSEEIN